MKIIIVRQAFVLSVAVLLSGAWGCGIVRDPDIVVVARIGKDKILMGDLSRRIARMPFEQRANLLERKQRLAVLNQMVERRVLLTEADALGITASPDDILTTLRMSLQAQGDPRAQTASPEELMAMLDADTVDMPRAETLRDDYGLGEQDLESMHAERVEQKEQLRKRIEEETRIRKLVESLVGSNVQVTEQDVRNFYDAHPDRLMMPETVRFRYMSATDLVGSEKVLDQVRAGTSFEQLVKEAAEASDGKLAGESPLLAFNSLPEDVRPSMAEAQLDVVVGPLRRSDNRYDLVEVIERNPPTLVPFDSVKAQIRAELLRVGQQSAVVDYVRQLREKYEVRIYADRVRAERSLETMPDPHRR